MSLRASSIWFKIQMASKCCLCVTYLCIHLYTMHFKDGLSIPHTVNLTVQSYWKRLKRKWENSGGGIWKKSPRNEVVFEADWIELGLEGVWGEPPGWGFLGWGFRGWGFRFRVWYIDQGVWGLPSIMEDGIYLKSNQIKKRFHQGFHHSWSGFPSS